MNAGCIKNTVFLKHCTVQCFCFSVPDRICRGNREYDKYHFVHDRHIG